jgi:thiol-disulfide isomerase/thioredoxin
MAAGASAKGNSTKGDGAQGSGARRRKIAERRAAAARQARIRRQILLAGGSVVAVIVVVVAVVLAQATSGKGTAPAASAAPTGTALQSLVTDVTTVPTSVVDAVGQGSLSNGEFTKENGTPLTADGKPELLYVGAEFCPYCAAERWPMIIALSRFGTFSGLSATTSSTTDSYPGTPTFTFYGSTYQSKYLSFVPVEETTNYRQGHSASTTVPYVTLQTPTAAEQTVLNTYDPGADGNSIPFIDIGNKYVEIANLAPYGPQDLSGKNWSQIAAALRDPSSTIAQGADASANYLTAGICALTGNQPATACTAPIQALEANV